MAQIRAACRPNVALNESPFENAPSLADILSDPDAVLPAEALEKSDLNHELDLALSKLRNVYEILTMIKADSLNELISAPAAAMPVAEVVAKPEPQPEVQVTPEPQAVAPDPAILAEKFSPESSINENLAEKQGGQVDAKLVGQAIDNISRNIGINDRFLIIRELFEGDSDGFSKLLGLLDTAESYQSAAALLEEHFSGSAEHEGVEILSGLVKRRYIR